MERFEESLVNQVEYLIEDCIKFDEGRRNFAIPMAAKLRVILNTTRDKKGKVRDKSILRHLNSTHIHFYNTISTPIDGKNLMADYPMVYITASSNLNESGFHPSLDSQHVAPNYKYRSFENWWMKDLIYSDNAKENGKDISTKFTRWLLVLSVANKDGGTHLDDDLPDDYYKLSRNYHVTTFFNNQEKKHQDLHFVMIRQIAHETLLTLYRNFKYIDIEDYYKRMNQINDMDVMSLKELKRLKK